MHKDMILNELHKSYASSMHKDTVFNELYLSYASSMNKDTIFNEIYLSYASSKHKDTIFNILDEFIHIIRIEKKETILIEVTSGYDTTVGFLLSIKHTYTAEKLKFLPFPNSTKDPCDPIR